MSVAMLVLLLICRSSNPLQVKGGARAGERLFHQYSNRILFGDEVQQLSYVRDVPSFGLFSPNKAPCVMIHGFGGNSGQWRKNLPALKEAGHAAYAIDLLGYGYSSKPDPRTRQVNEIYNFENWAEQTADFVKKVVRQPAYLVCNSVGGVVGLQMARTNPELVKGVILIDVSLRLLHVKKQNFFTKPIVKAIQTTLRETPAGAFFFKQVAQKKAIKNILSQAYAEVVDDETVDVILNPGLQPGAAEVFLDFISYSGGPLPEDLLGEISQAGPDKRPVRILWGENDPWEPIDLGLATFSSFDCVDEFVTLPGGGHCPMDQIPDRVNSEILRFIA